VLSGHDHNLVVAYDGRTAIAETQADGAQVVAVDLAVKLSDGSRARSPGRRSSAFSTRPTRRRSAVAARAADIRARLDKGLDEPVGVTRTELDGRKASVRGKRRGSAISSPTPCAPKPAPMWRSSTAARFAATRSSRRRDADAQERARRPAFANRLVTLELSGADLRAALESAYGGLGRDAAVSPRFPARVSRYAATPFPARASRRSRWPARRSTKSASIGSRPMITSPAARTDTTPFCAASRSSRGRRAACLRCRHRGDPQGGVHCSAVDGRVAID